MTIGGRTQIDLLVGPLAASLDDILEGHGSVAVAVSGGSDSVALMHLIAERARRRTALFDTTTIVTVDHRLRPESTEEARRVGEMARTAGFARHVVLSWNGPHPATGIQAAARAARYGLIGDYCCSNGIPALLTAHTRDDQAETALMRLARGTGIGGLAGMASSRRLDNGIVHHRPLLDVSRADLRGYLVSIGAVWIDDPSNDDPAFERIRWRKARADLDGLGLTDPALALTASRAARAVEALDWAVAREVGAAGDNYVWSSLGFAVLSRGWLISLPAEIRIRILGASIQATGGQGSPPSLSALEGACSGLCNSSSPLRRGFTLAGAMVRSTGDRLTVFREAIGSRRGSITLPDVAALVVNPGAAAVWDRRFAIDLDPSAPGPATVGPLGETGVAGLRAAGVPLPAGVPSRVLWALPAVRFPISGLAVPHLHVWPSRIRPGIVKVAPVSVPFEPGTKDETCPGI